MLLPALLHDLDGPSPAARAAAQREVAEQGRPLPDLVAWNLTPACARRCGSCRVLAGDGARGRGELSTIECLHLVHQITSLHPCTLLLSGGDPLRREDVETIALHAVRRGSRVAVATPGVRLGDARLRALCRAGVSGLVLALTSLDAERHARLGHEGPLDVALAAGAACRELGLRLVVHVRLVPETFDEVTRLAEWCVLQGAHALHLEVPAAEPGASVALARALVAVERELALVERRHGRRLSLRVARTGEACACSAAAARITPDGKLTPCPCSVEGAEDLRRRPFAAAWLDAPAFVSRRAREAAGAAAAMAAEAEAPATPQLALDFEPGKRGRGSVPGRGRAR